MFNTPTQNEKHNVFVSFHNEDRHYRSEFDRMYGHLFNSKSVDFGDIAPDNDDEYIKRLIQEEHITDSSVIVALYGANTWKRKHIDWEISAGLNKKVGGHSGLIVMILPNFPVSPYDAFGSFNESSVYSYLHPRTVANIKSGFAGLYYWPGMCPHLPSVRMEDAIQAAFDRRMTHKDVIDNSHPQYQYNRT